MDKPTSDAVERTTYHVTLTIEVCFDVRGVFLLPDELLERDGVLFETNGGPCPNLEGLVERYAEGMADDIYDEHGATHLYLAGVSFKPLPAEGQG